MSSTAQPQTANRPRVGVAVFIVRPISSPNDSNSSDGSSTSASNLEFVIGLRKGSHGAGTWALPGGHLEYGESFETCAVREVLEETDLAITNVRYLTATNDVFAAEGKHYITLFVVAEVEGQARQEPVVVEPEKCERWEWVGWETLVGWVDGKGREEARKMFLPMLNLVDQRPGVVPLLL